MGVFDMIVIVVVVGCITGVISDYLKTKRKTGGILTEELDEALDRIEDLEERIKVLERVVTDDKYDLGRQIDQLNDSP
ncbi:MAG: hypothetical protein WD002_06740 [Pseudomonadales bacterium]